MKFDEANDELSAMQTSAGTRSQGNIERAEYSCLEVHKILNDIECVIDGLQEEYAPTLELTKDQKYIWDKSYSEKLAQEDFIYFIDTIYIEDKYTNLFTELINEFRSHSRVLMNAWLHPESIKVVE